jgi:hypothetical protein
VRFQTEITTMSAHHGLDPWLVMGLVSVESAFKQYSWNPEPRYRYFWNVRAHVPFRAVTNTEVANKFPPGDFPTVAGDSDQEWWGQQASWGLMQILGAVAREEGFAGLYLPELCDVTSNLEAGCAHLSKLLLWAKGDVDRALAAYNGGKGGNMAKPYHNQLYADRVISARSTLKG